MRTPLACLALAAALTGCPRATDKYCDENTEAEPERGNCDPQTEYCDFANRVCLSGDRPDAGPVACDTNDDCPDDRPYCGDLLCQPCGPEPGDPNACGPTAPVCTDAFDCRPCEADAECPSQVCMADGGCADESNVLYAAVGEVDGSPCEKTNPCSLDGAITLVSTTKHTIHLAAGQYNRTTLAFNQDVTLVGREAIINYASGVPGSVVSIAGVGNKLRADFVTLQNADTSGDGVNCVDGEVELRSVTIRQNDDKGIDASSCVVAVSRSTITSNAGGGILLVNSGFDITNNIIHTNQTITFGGVYIQNVSTTTAMPRRLEFNTIANNNGAAASGVSCQFVSDPLVFHSNIIFANDSATDTENLSGALCTHEYSAIEAAGAGTTGTGVVTTNPMFVNEGGGNFLLSGGSPMRELASPSATMTIDYQGEPRPQPATGARNDIGADEIP